MSFEPVFDDVNVDAHRVAHESLTNDDARELGEQQPSGCGGKGADQRHRKRVTTQKLSYGAHYPRRYRERRRVSASVLLERRLQVDSSPSTDTLSTTRAHSHTERRVRVTKEKGSTLATPLVAPCASRQPILELLGA